jgi:hypothetical protein
MNDAKYDSKHACELRLRLFGISHCGLGHPNNSFGRSLTLFRDFACGLGRPQKRLNLLKRFAASTLGIFHSEHILRGFARFVGDREGGEDEWVGPVLRLRSLVFF